MEVKPQLRDILILLTIPNFGLGRVRRLLTIFNCTEEIKRTPIQRLVQIEGIDRKLASQIKSGGSPEIADKQISDIEKHKLNSVTIWDKFYPALLKSTYDPPLVLFYKGWFNMALQS
jgi:DNA processing protein